MARRPIALLLCLLARAAGAGETPAASPAPGRAHYERGRDLVNHGDYDAAIREFRAGYDALPQPLFLYNIAECARAAGRDELAVEYYTQYLEKRPDAPDRDEVRRRIARLSKGKPRPQPSTPDPASLPSAVVPPSPGPAPALGALAPATVAAISPGSSVDLNAVGKSQAPSGEKRKLVRRAWFWTAVGGGVLLVGGAIALGVTFGTTKVYPSSSLRVANVQ